MRVTETIWIVWFPALEDPDFQNLRVEVRKDVDLREVELLLFVSIDGSTLLAFFRQAYALTFSQLKLLT